MELLRHATRPDRRAWEGCPAVQSSSSARTCSNVALQEDAFGLRLIWHKQYKRRGSGRPASERYCVRKGGV